MIRELALSIVILGVLVCAVLFFISRPVTVDAASLPQHTADLANGKLMFTAGGCQSCHKPPDDAAGVDKALPSGGAALKTPIGTFYPPNLTPDDETGIGRWQDAEFVAAMKYGTSPDGRHYLPAFPYTSYAAMRTEDIMDLHAYLKSLKPVKSQARAPDVTMLWVMRQGIGVWKLLGLRSATYQPDPQQSDAWNRGAYLVNSAGHCGECHTPRNLLMISDLSRYLAGGPHPEGGKDKVPSLRSLVERKRFKDATDLATALQWGEAFGYEDMSSGGMGAVQTNLSKLPTKDLEAMAEFLVSLK